MLGRRGRATIVDARALNTAVRIVQAFLLELAPRAVIKTLASAPLAQVMSVTATILPIILLLTNINVGARPKSVAGAPFFGLSQQSDGAVGAAEILRQVYGIALCRNIVLDEFAVSCDRRQVDQRSIVEI